MGSAAASYSQPTSLLTLLSPLEFRWLLGSKSKFSQWPLHLSEQHTQWFWLQSLSISPSEHDECASSQNLCDENAICTNTIRGHLCTCKPGYVGNGTICRGKFLPWYSPPGTKKKKDTDIDSNIVWWCLVLCSITSWITPPSHHLTSSSSSSCHRHDEN